MGLASGVRLGPYEVIRLIGAGGMGEVYQARDTKLDRDVAVKVLPDAFVQDADRLARFEREAKAVAAISHPNILAIFDYGTTAGRVYAVTELLDGASLRGELEHGALPQRQAIDYALQISRGLAAAHEKGIVHRDLKPENLFVTRDGRVKILDFGLARLASPDDQAESSDRPTAFTTQAGVVMGTVGYMAPEQIKGLKAGPGADIFAFGAVLFEMLTGKRPFQRNSPAETQSAILTADPPELATITQSVTPGLDQVVRHCLEKDPARRFHSMHDVGLALESLAGGSGPTGPVPDSAVRSRSRAPAAVIAGVGLVALAVSGALLLRGGGRVTPPTFTQLNFRSEAVFAARFSPDGKTVVYSAAPEGNIPGIVVVRPDYPAGRSLAVPDVHLLAVSSSGELAVLTRARYQCHRVFTGTLASLPIGGEAPREILADVRGADWGPDGSKLAIIRGVHGEDRLEFPIGTVLHRSSGYLSDLRVSPDGQRVAFFEHPAPCDDRGRLAMVDLAGSVTVLTGEHTSEEGLAWSPDGREVFIAAAVENGQRALDAVSLTGKVRSVLRAPADLALCDVSSAGRVLLTREDAQYRIRGRGVDAREEVDLTWLASMNPRISSDGRKVLFADEAAPFGPTYAVVLRGIDGSPPVRLGDGMPFGFSPDGQSVLAIVYAAPPQIVVYATGAGETRRLDRGPLEAVQTAQWFPDGRRVMLCGNEAGRAVRCYAQPASGGALTPISPDITRARQAMLSPDGTRLLATDVKGQLRMFRTDGGTELDPGPGLGALAGAPVAWSADGQSVFTRGSERVPIDIDRVELATGHRERVLSLGPPDRTGVLKVLSVAIARDGAAYAYAYTQLRGQLYVADGLR